MMKRNNVNEPWRKKGNETGASVEIKTKNMDEKWRSRVARLAFLFVFGAALLYEPMMFTNATTTTIDTSSITASFDNLKAIVTAIISSIGVIITLWGISEWGIAFQGQDGTMQASAFKRIAGGMVMVLAPQIVGLLV